MQNYPQQPGYGPPPGYYPPQGWGTPPPPRKKSYWWVWLLGIFGALFLCGIVGSLGNKGSSGPSSQGNAGPPRPGAGAAAAPKPAEEAEAVTAAQLLAEYKDNEVRGDARFKGKLVRVTGVVDTIGKDILDDPYVTLGAGGPYEMQHVQCMLPKSQLQAAAALNKGAKATVTGRVGGLTLLNVMLKDCEID